MGVNPATHKICKNNAIILTVYKDPEVIMLVKVRKSVDHEDVFFSFSVCFIFFLVNSVIFMPEKPNILEIRYISVQYDTDVFIYLLRIRMPIRNVH